ncbi:hypothetical protein AV530_014511 [Patagioenas fasciata monilis]|uniref:Uncharacterized protein n=1 Tax=Patagioenas fasciata monilis TaxID=372326 RepID=A0A1V4KC91_PATFA|nr:hypothetical protein AV530_014511 [Patagioenas fasciata monilis]
MGFAEDSKRTTKKAIAVLSVSEVWYQDCYSSILAAGGRALSQRCLTDQSVENIILRTTVSFAFEHLPLYVGQKVLLDVCLNFGTVKKS